MSSFRKILAFIFIAIFVVGAMYVGITYATTNYVPGTTVGRTYVSTFLNIRMNLPDNFSFMTGGSIPDDAEMFAISSDRMCNVGLLTEEVFPLVPLSACATSIQNVLKNQASMEYTFSGATSRRIAGEEYYFMRGDTTYNGVHMNQDIYMRKIGSRCCAIVITYTPSTIQSTSERDTFIKCIESYK